MYSVHLHPLAGNGCGCSYERAHRGLLSRLHEQTELPEDDTQKEHRSCCPTEELLHEHWRKSVLLEDRRRQLLNSVPSKGLIFFQFSIII